MRSGAFSGDGVSRQGTSLAGHCFHRTALRRADLCGAAPLPSQVQLSFWNTGLIFTAEQDKEETEFSSSGSGAVSALTVSLRHLVVDR